MKPDNPRLLSREWKEFAKACGLDKVGSVQRKEMLRAFMAGAMSYYTLMMRSLENTGDPDDVTVTDLDLMEALHDELVQFGNDVGNGRK
jgi:hypothetical protein